MTLLRERLIGLPQNQVEAPVQVMLLLWRSLERSVSTETATDARRKRFHQMGIPPSFARIGAVLMMMMMMMMMTTERERGDEDTAKATMEGYDLPRSSF